MNEIAVSEIRPDLLFGSIVEAIDTKAARVLARASVDGWVIAVPCAGELAIWKVDEAGVGHAEIVRVELVRGRDVSGHHGSLGSLTLQRGGG